MTISNRDTAAYPLLDRIGSPDDLRKLPQEQLDALCAEIRSFLISTLSRTGGHVASNLGVVELTVALHRCFDTAADRLIFDVGHQCYTHKLLTGRRELFSTLRTSGGLSGFPKPTESAHDAFIAGHSSNSISVALGFARAQAALPESERHHVVALIGDGALTGGLAYEGLDDAGGAKLPLIVVLNDNGMSIGQSVGGLSKMLTRFRIRPDYQNAKQNYHRFMEAIPGGQKLNRFFTGVKDGIKHTIIPGTFFESMGFEYIGPVDGHDVKELVRIFEQAKTFRRPVLIHAITQKGRGYEYSEGSPEHFHGVEGFDIASGKCVKHGSETFSAAFGNAICDLAAENENIITVTAAMQAGVGLNPMAARFPARCVDAGIAEAHTVAMAAGMAAGGKRPVVAVYSTFLQRAYDSLMHDVGLMHLPVVFCVDRSGLVGEDGETHQGLYDMAMLKSVPGMQILMPANSAEMKTMLTQALRRTDGPTALRYPRGALAKFADNTAAGPVCPICSGADLTILAAGRMVDQALAAADTLAEQGICAGVLKVNRVHPLPAKEIFASSASRILVVEENAANGSMGSALAEAACNGDVRVFPLNCGDAYIPQGTVAEQMASCGIDAASIALRAETILRGERN